MVHLRLDRRVSEQASLEVWPVYDRVFADFPDHQSWMEGLWERHRARDGFRLARAYGDGGLVGFAYGYTGADGQWWTDNARAVLDAEVGDAWLGGHFELVSVGVLPEARQRGIGRRLMRLLTDDLPHDRLLLMATSDDRDPARVLYASEGWQVVGPGIGQGTVILGRRNQQPTGRASAE